MCMKACMRMVTAPRRGLSKGGDQSPFNAVQVYPRTRGLESVRGRKNACVLHTEHKLRQRPDGEDQNLARTAFMLNPSVMRVQFYEAL